MRIPVKAKQQRKFKLRFAIFPVIVKGYWVWLEFYYKFYYREQVFDKFMYKRRVFKKDYNESSY